MKHCKNGHAMTGANVMRNGASTCCRACRNERKRRARQARSDLPPAPTVTRVPYVVARDPWAAAIFGGAR